MCKVCKHPDVEAINERLKRGEPDRAIASLTGIHRSSIQRHRQAHLQASVLATRFVEGSEAPDRILDAHARLDAVIARAQGVDDELVLKALKERREYLAYEKPPVQRTKDETPREVAWEALPQDEKEKRLRRAEVKISVLRAQLPAKGETEQ
jgi:hypothetical protein